MKLSLPIKLGIFVVLVFSVVIVTCLLWTPLKIRYYSSKLRSKVPEVRVTAVNKLMSFGSEGKIALSESIGGEEALGLLEKYWNNVNEIVDLDGCRKTPLIMAIEKNYSAVVGLFIDGGASLVEQRWDDRGFDTRVLGFTSPSLHCAVRQGNTEIVSLLISRGADTNHCEPTGFFGTPISIATNRSDKRMIKFLVSKGADINARSNSGMTSMHFVVSPARMWGQEDRFEDICEFLIEMGADINAMDERGKTPLDHAMVGKESVIQFLRARGAKTAAELKADKK